MNESTMQEFYELKGRVDALHAIIKQEAAKREKSEYITDRLSDGMMTVCLVLGFTDLLEEG